MAETFGETTKLPTERTLIKDSQIAFRFTSGSAGTLASISVYLDYVSLDTLVKCAIYDGTGAGSSDHPLLENGVTEEKLMVSGQDGWVAFNFATPPAVAASTPYYLCFFDNHDIHWYRDTGVSDWQYLFDKNTYDGFTNPFVQEGNGNYKASIFATYYEAPAVKTLVQAALISIPPLIILPTLSQIIKLTGGC